MKVIVHPSRCMFEKYETTFQILVTHKQASAMLLWLVLQSYVQKSARWME